MTSPAGWTKLSRALVAIAFGLLAASWAMTTPPGGFPDELEHYVRGLSVGRGEIYGSRNPQLDDPAFTEAPAKSCCVPGNATALYWVVRGVRIVDIPAGLAPEHLACASADHRVVYPCDTDFPSSGSAKHHSTMGTLEPAAYVVPGLATRLADNPNTALTLARLANALVSAALLAIAVFALWPSERGCALAPAGLVAAVTPMVLFVAASPSPSSVEISAAVAVFALLLRMSRPTTTPRWTWAALALSGICLATSRSFGPVWIAIDAVTVVVLAGVRPAVAVVVRGGRRSLLVIATVGAAGVSTVLWELGYQPKVPFDYRFFHDELYPSVLQLDRVAHELIGRFGQIDITLPAAAFNLWCVGLVVLAVTALVVGSARDRLLLLTQCLLVVGVTVLVTAGIMRQNGFDIQGRHVLALAVTAPMLAGEIVHRRRARLPRAVAVGLPPVMAAGAAAVHVVAMVRAGRAYGWLGSAAPDAWTPAGGPGLWLAVTVLAALMFTAGFVLAAGAGEDRAQSGPIASLR